MENERKIYIVYSMGDEYDNSPSDIAAFYTKEDANEFINKLTDEYPFEFNFYELPIYTHDSLNTLKYYPGRWGAFMTEEELLEDLEIRTKTKWFMWEKEKPTKQSAISIVCNDGEYYLDVFIKEDSSHVCNKIGDDSLPEKEDIIAWTYFK